MTSYILWYKLDFQNRYTIWQGNDDCEKDKLYTINGIIPSFSTIPAIEEFSNMEGIELENEKPIKHNLDTVKFWLANPAGKIICGDFLAAWNLFGDTAWTFNGHGEPFEKITQKYLNEYDKLFFGSNLKVLRSYRQKYYPKWTSSNVKNIRIVLKTGLKFFKQNLRTI